jgi:hypothetical protein
LEQTIHPIHPAPAQPDRRDRTMLPCLPNQIHGRPYLRKRASPHFSRNLKDNQ